MGSPKNNCPKAHGQPKGLSKVFTAAVYKAFYFHAARTEEFTTGVHSTICIPYLFWCLGFFFSLGGYLMFLWFWVVEKTIQRTARIWGF
jgi:hypothetical protein